MLFVFGYRYEKAERRRVSTGLFGFSMPDADTFGGGGRGGDGFLPSKQMRSLQKEQRKFLRGTLAVSDPIRYSSKQNATQLVIYGIYYIGRVVVQ